MKLSRFLMLFLVMFLLNAVIPLPSIFTTNYVYAAEEPWKTEFEQLCAETENAVNMSIEALANSLERCNKLRPQIEQLEATPRKIYLKRLQMCCNLFTYMIESKKQALQKP